MKLSNETIKSFLEELCNPTCMDPIVVISKNDIQVQSNHYNVDDGYVEYDRVEDAQEFFLGDLNNYDYENATSDQIDELIKNAYQNIDWIDEVIELD